MKISKIFAGLILCAAVAFVISSCSNDEELNVQKSNELVPVRVHVNDFSIEMDEFQTTRTEPKTPAEYDNVQAMTLAFYNGATEVYKTTQLRSDQSNYTTFGDFTLGLPMGSYTMVVLGYGYYDGVELTLTSPTQAEYTAGSVRETFAATQPVSITSTDAVDLEATLNRIVAQLKVISTDNRTANISNVRMTFSAGGKRFSPTTGLATTNTGFANTVSIGSAVGAKSGSISYLFLDSDVQNIDVTIETLDADGHTIFSKVVSDVPFKRNRITKLSGAMYSNTDVSASFLVNSDWLADYNGTF